MMFGFIKRIKLFFKQDEIAYLKRAINRTRYQIDEINASFDHRKDCCTTCMTGGYDLILDRKLHRQVMWLRVLLRRKNRLNEVAALEAEFGKETLDAWEVSGGKG